MEIQGNELRIICPSGMEIDKEHSTLDCIKFKPVAKRWRDTKFKQFDGYYIHLNSEIMKDRGFPNTPNNHNVFATKKQAKSALAMAYISQIMANDERFGGVVTDEEWNNMDIIKYTIERQNSTSIIKKLNIITSYSFLAFHTAEQRDLFLKENEDLVKHYLMID